MSARPSTNINRKIANISRWSIIADDFLNEATPTAIRHVTAADFMRLGPHHLRVVSVRDGELKAIELSTASKLFDLAVPTVKTHN